MGSTLQVVSQRHLMSDWQLSSMVSKYLPSKHTLACSALLFIAMIFCVRSVWSQPERVLENVEYLSIDGKAAVRINFSDLITYKKHFPENQGNTLEVHVGLVEATRAVSGSNIVATEVLLAPISNEIPLVGVTYEGQDLNDPILVLRFSRPVEYELNVASNRRALLIKLPGIDFIEVVPPVDSLKLASEEITVQEGGSVTSNEDEAKRLINEGKRFLATSKFNDAIRSFTSVLNLPDHGLQREAGDLLAQTRNTARETALGRVAKVERGSTDARPSTIDSPLPASANGSDQKPDSSATVPLRSVGIGTSNYERQLSFGRLAMERGDFKNAMRIFSIVLAADDNHPYKDEARKLLAEAESNVAKAGLPKSSTQSVGGDGNQARSDIDSIPAISVEKKVSRRDSKRDDKVAELMSLARAAVERSDRITAQRLLAQVLAIPKHEFLDEARRLKEEIELVQTVVEVDSPSDDVGSREARTEPTVVPSQVNDIEKLEDPVVLMELGRAAMKRNDLDGATRVFTRVLNLPAHPFIQEAERLLRQATSQASAQGDLRDPIVADPSTLDDVVRLVEQGRIALTEGNSNRAIVIFTKLTEIPEHPHSKESMEYLGVARQRNNQIAHAKSIFEQFLKKFPKGEDADRVKQRLADLISSQIKPKERLAAAPEPKKNQQFKTDTFGSWSQYFYYGTTSIDTLEDKQTDQLTLLSYLTANTRTRSDRYDIRAFIYGTHTADLRKEEEKSLSSRNRDRKIELSTLYVDVHDKKLGLQGRIGRQSSSTPGVLGRFDGALFGMDVVPKIRLNVIGGFPVDLNDKGRVNGDTQFIATNVQFDDLIKNLDVIPYASVQYSEDLLDRFAIGEEIRYFNPRGNFFNLIDYDVSYGSLNIFLVHGQYNINKDHSAHFNVDYRNSPLIFTKNAIIGNQNFTTLKEGLLQFSEDQLREEALRRTGKSTILTIGLTNQFSDKIQLSNDVSYTNQVYSDAIVNPEQLPVDPTQPDPPPDAGQEPEIRQIEDAISINSRLTTMGILGEREITIFSIGYTSATSYDDFNLGFQNRAPFGEGWAVDSRIRADIRKDIRTDLFNEAEERTLLRVRPSLKLNYSWKRTFNIETEIGVEISRYSDSTKNPDTDRTFGSIGYRWNF